MRPLMLKVKSSENLSRKGSNFGGFRGLGIREWGVAVNIGLELPFSLWWKQLLNFFSMTRPAQFIGASASTHTRARARAHARVYTGSASLNESSSSSLLWYDGVWRIKLRSTWAITAFRSPPSAADTSYDQPTSISWLYRAVSRLLLAVGLSLWWARRSGTHYRPSFVLCLSVLVTLSARLRRYYTRDISAFSAIEIFALGKSPILFYSTLYIHQHLIPVLK